MRQIGRFLQLVEECVKGACGFFFVLFCYCREISFKNIPVDWEALPTLANLRSVSYQQLWSSSSCCISGSAWELLPLANAALLREIKTSVQWSCSSSECKYRKARLKESTPEKNILWYLSRRNAKQRTFQLIRLVLDPYGLTISSAIPEWLKSEREREKGKEIKKEM